MSLTDCKLCNLAFAHIKEIIQQYGFPLFFRQTVQGFGKQLRSNFFAADNERLFCFIICKIFVADVKLIFFQWRQVGKSNLA